jgi:two-component system, OmpR family, sensor kinase
MTLRARLTLVFALAMVVVLIGTGTTLFLYLRADLREDFKEDLERLAAAYAENVTFAPKMQLRNLPKSPVPEEIEDANVYLLNPQGQQTDAIGTTPIPIIPAIALTQIRNGQIASFDIASPELRPLLLVALSPVPLPLERRAVLHPIAKSKYFVLVSANDLGLVRILEQVRNSIALWGLVGTIIALSVGFILAGYVSRPLNQISTTALAVEHGALSSRIPDAKGSDEISRLKRRLNTMLNRLETLVESQRRFTADAAHDLRTPLTVIRGELEITLRKPRSLEEYRQTLERLLKEVKHFSQLAEDLLLLSKLESGTEIPKQKINLAQALEPILTTHSVTAQRNQVAFHVYIPSKLELYADPTAIARAVSNLLSNAMIHGLRIRTSQTSTITNLKPNQEIGLEVIRAGLGIQIRVFDSGIGIPKTQHKHLFERFSLGENSSGTGLGLAIVAQVAEQHAGKAFYEPRPEGGSVFILELPIGLEKT